MFQAARHVLCGEPLLPIADSDLGVSYKLFLTAATFDPAYTPPEYEPWMNAITVEAANQAITLFKNKWCETKLYRVFQAVSGRPARKQRRHLLKRRPIQGCAKHV